MASVLLSLAWLLPNHSMPWMSFHSDAWAAAMLVVMGGVVMVRARQSVAWHGLVWVVALLLPLPFAHHALGLLPFAGQAWTASAYIAGFLLAMMVGQHWQGWRPRWMGDILFSAIGIGAIVSVALQFQQWLEPGGDGTLSVWALGSNSARPSGNMAQPNQLATLLLWGLLACAWGVWRRQLGRAAALIATTFLLIGLALTQSRTGALGLLVLLLAAWWWRGLWEAKNTPWYATGLALFYVLALLALGPLRSALMLDVSGSMVQRLGHELRPELWRMLLDAALQRPWVGYGWNNVVAAQVTVAEGYPALYHPFLQSHNLFLDFMLWAGIPLGLVLTALVLAWLVTAARRIRRAPEGLYLLMVLMVGIHAMLELPLHYAYFLLPTGLAMGALNASLNIWPMGSPSRIAGRWLLLGALCLGATLLGLIARDYFKVESAYASLQLERANIVNSRPAEPPDVLLLTDLREAQRFMKYEPVAGVSPAEIQWARDATVVWPSSRSFMTLAVLLGLNQHPDEARDWLIKMCRIVPPDQCESAPARWAQARRFHPQLAAVEWPPEESESASVITP
ncbi:PglL family O-oligosaccharyltransferase [Variovorax sp. MHTC-1]|uniref:PglL family O-oligosaccharyltransferase n=1 Tax=Variovorax sp. MHTC-1 TaxID=2495593 RepID=UPI00163CD61C|nr:O-antigen ligase family protein [Variovorax sp. MHTC-1]